MSDAALASLKTSPKLTQGILGLAKAFRAGFEPELILKVLANCGDLRICNGAYTAGHLLDDIGEIAHVPGLEHLLKQAKGAGSGVLGFRFELEGAAFLKRTGANVVELSMRVATAVVSIAAFVRPPTALTCVSSSVSDTGT